MNNRAKPYISRVVDAELSSFLKASGAVVIEGPKACGKTATALQHANTVISLDRDDSARSLASIDPSPLLTGQPPILIDEWQLATNLWNEVRHQVDERSPNKGQFILTGSSTPDDDARRHSGAGRIIPLRMRPMTIFEQGYSSATVSLKDIMSKATVSGRGKSLPISIIAELVSVGGWPGLVGSDIHSALLTNRGYIDQAVEVDLPRLLERRRDPQRLLRLLRSLARNVGSQVAITKLAKEAGGVETPLDRNTTATYLDELTRLHLLEDLPAWNTHLRSRTSLTTTAKRMFVDPSLAVAALSTTPEKLIADLEYFGFLFENLVVRDLRVLSAPLGGKVYHAKFSDDTEVDAVIELRDGTWAACEVKLGGSWIDAGAANLKRWAARIDTTQAGEPAALMVIVPEGYCYKRPDGVLVVPLSALAPKPPLHKELLTRTALLPLTFISSTH